MNGDTFILFTTEQGGYFKAILGTREQYDEAVASGVLRVHRPDYDDHLLGKEAYDEHTLAFIAFGAVEANHDFRLKPEPGSRDKEEVDV